MESKEIEKALLGIAKALENNDSVKKITVKIELEKPKPSKAKPKSR